MGAPLSKDKNVVDWPAMRSAFIESDEKPTYAELSESFRVPLSTVCSTAADEGWVLQRSRYLEKVALACGATEAIIDLAKGNREVASTFINFALVGVKRLTKVVESIEEGTKARAESDIIQNCAFAAANFAKSLKELGITVIPKELADGLGSGSGSRDFLKSALQQINVSVNVAQGKAEPAKETPKADVELPE